MNGWWIAFIAVETLIAGVVAVTRWRSGKDSTSMDVAIGVEIGNMLLIALGIVLAIVAFCSYAWHHFRFAP